MSSFLDVPGGFGVRSRRGVGPAGGHVRGMDSIQVDNLRVTSATEKDHVNNLIFGNIFVKTRCKARSMSIL